MATDRTTTSANLIWSTSDRLRLKVKANKVVALNKQYEIADPLPDGLVLFDEEGDQIENASFVDIRQNYSIQYDSIRYSFNDTVAERPPPPPQQETGKFAVVTPFFTALFEYGNSFDSRYPQ
jgi:hypothetical protein